MMFVIIVIGIIMVVFSVVEILSWFIDFDKPNDLKTHNTEDVAVSEKRIKYKKGSIMQRLTAAKV